MQKLIAERDLKIIQLEVERDRLASENKMLNATPLATAEWQRQEAVAALGNALDIMSDVSIKTGIAYGHMASIQGVFVNKGALNMSARTRREIALGQESGDRAA